ncbi:hypothetical protein ASD36_01335 [Rhizobium sp. Root1334]|nr:hypothetical protein ASD36_01335 [Rhizobium sp. Root1334]
MGASDVSITAAMAALRPSRPPLSLRDISPTRGEITIDFAGHLTGAALNSRPISPLVGEMSRSDRGGYLAELPKPFFSLDTPSNHR